MGKTQQVIFHKHNIRLTSSVIGQYLFDREIIPNHNLTGISDDQGHALSGLVSLRGQRPSGHDGRLASVVSLACLSVRLGDMYRYTIMALEVKLELLE